MPGRSRRDAPTAAAALTAVALALAGLVAACGGGDDRGAGAPTREADVDGEVRSVTPTPDGGVVALIVPPGDPCGVATTVEPDDRVLVETADGLEEADVDALREARSARAWLDTPIAESCPAQAGASDVVIAGAAP
jgi:hypothetical protein